MLTWDNNDTESCEKMSFALPWRKVCNVCGKVEMRILFNKSELPNVCCFVVRDFEMNPSSLWKLKYDDNRLVWLYTKKIVTNSKLPNQNTMSKKNSAYFEKKTNISVQSGRPTVVNLLRKQPCMYAIKSRGPTSFWLTCYERWPA